MIPKPSSVHLLPVSKSVSPAELLDTFPHGEIFACDFAVEGAAGFKPHPWGYSKGRLKNIDHHADAPRMERQISSANLALLWSEGGGKLGEDAQVVINHTDCDSVLTAAIVSGDIEPLPEFGKAALCADHTGEENAIADLLQALDPRRDYPLSLRNLRLLLAGQPIDPDAQSALEERRGKRAEAKRLVQNGAFTNLDGVAFATIPRAVDGEFFPALLPTAHLIAVFVPHAEPGKWMVKLRLGQAAPNGLSLHQLGVPAFDANYGGRWNAGSNKRGGGTTLSPDDYARHLQHALSTIMANTAHLPL